MYCPKIKEKVCAWLHNSLNYYCYSKSGSRFKFITLHKQEVTNNHSTSLSKNGSKL